MKIEFNPTTVYPEDAGEKRSRRLRDSADAGWTKVQRRCIICAPSRNSLAELMLETMYWRFYYCPIGVHWFQASASDGRVAKPVTARQNIRALTLIYTERQQTLHAISTFGDPLRKVHRRLVTLAARAYLRLSRLGEPQA